MRRETVGLTKMERTHTATAGNGSPAGGTGGKASQPLRRVDRCGREPGAGGGDPKGKRCASWGGGPRKAPARDSAAETETGGDRGDRYCSYGISVAVSDGERRGFSARPPVWRGRPRKLFHHFLRKVMSLINLKLHKGRERVRERINDGESPPFFILYLLI